MYGWILDTVKGSINKVTKAEGHITTSAKKSAEIPIPKVILSFLHKKRIVFTVVYINGRVRDKKNRSREKRNMDTCANKSYFEKIDNNRIHGIQTVRRIKEEREE